MKGVTVPREPREARAMILALTSGLAAFVGFAYSPMSNVPARLPLGLSVVSSIVPLWVFGAIWLITGVGGIAAVTFRRRAVAIFAAQFAMFLTWTGAYTTAWVLGDPRAWLTAYIFFTFAGIVAFAARVDPPLWRSPRRWLKWKP